MGVQYLLLTAMLAKGAQAKEDPLALLSARVDRYTAALSSPSSKVRAAVLDDWSKSVRRDQDLLNSASHFRSKGGRLDVEANRKATNPVFDKIAVAITRSLESGDPAEFRAALHWSYCQHDRFYGNSWRWPQCGNHEPYISGCVNATAALKRHPDWAANLLDDPDPLLVGYVAAHLNETEPQLVREKALNWILGSKPKWRSIAIDLLAIGPYPQDADQESTMDADIVRRGLSDEDQDIRWQTFDAMGTCPEQKRAAYALLRREFKSQSPELKWSILHLAESFHDKSLIADANKLRSGTDPQLRCAVLHYLSRQGQPITTSETRFGIQNEELFLRRYWISEAGNHPDMWPELVRMLDDENDSSDAWSSLCNLATLQNLGFLVETFTHRNSPDGYSLSDYSLAYALGKLGESAANVTRQLYASSDPVLHRIALNAACRPRQTGLTDILDDCVHSKDPDERQHLADEIHWRKRDIAWPRLVTLLRDPVEDVRLTAIESMGAVALESDLPYLQELAASSNKNTSEAATSAVDTARERLSSGGR